MPATTIAPIAAPVTHAQAGAALVMTALDNTNGNQFAASTFQLVVVQNTDASPQTFQMTSQPEPVTGRVGHVSQAIAAGQIRMFRITREGWADGNGNVQIPSGQSNLLKVCILKVQ